MLESKSPLLADDIEQVFPDLSEMLTDELYDMCRHYYIIDAYENNYIELLKPLSESKKKRMSRHELAVYIEKYVDGKLDVEFGDCCEYEINEVVW